MKRLFLLLILFMSCDNNSDDGIVIPEPPQKLLNSISFDDETNIDSLFYEKGRLVLKKEYVGSDFVDYNTFYTRNDTGQLLKVSYMHSSSTDPSFVKDYTYYTNGNLKTINRSASYTYDISNQYFSYQGSQILIRVNNEQEASIIANLDSKNRIKEVLFKKSSSNAFYKGKQYFYNEAGNAYKIIVQSSEHANIVEYNYEFDNAENPYLSLDTDLPNGLTLNVVESLAFHDNYWEPREYHLPFFSKNNVVKYFTSNSSSDYYYTYTYNEDNYPIGIKYENFFNKPTLLLDYK
ncbi:hypothetical protein KFZ70_06575 [Tamlana fucoidanivorans]|uniref:DUF4595 domain-containing protein n=1 Tax=Allotamlana fucoidanivorans TaxID=2583814 RepID=A0A5C4SPJ4_9FLAO|nr:hypothetical protein [Tamlana fucoidanivorans]TNJ45324.1 hypothetical protein FGF67_06330 [Tamlana fucoidanivorans]